MSIAQGGEEIAVLSKENLRVKEENKNLIRDIETIAASVAAKGADIGKVSQLQATNWQKFRRIKFY